MKRPTPGVVANPVQPLGMEDGHLSLIGWGLAQSHRLKQTMPSILSLVCQRVRRGFNRCDPFEALGVEGTRVLSLACSARPLVGEPLRPDPEKLMQTPGHGGDVGRDGTQIRKLSEIGRAHV
jgi:hypothetical protein